MPRRYNRRPRTRRSFKKKRYSRATSKRITAPKFGGKIKQPVHYFKRNVDFGSISADGFGTETTGALNFSLIDVPGYTDFTNLYDAYKIVAVKVIFIPTSDNTTTTISSSNYNNRLFTCLDYNDSGVPATINTVREYHNCKVTGNNVIHKRFIYPKLELDTSHQFGANPWTDINSSSVNYFGLKYAFEQPTNDATLRYRIEAVYYMKFKSVT